MTADMSNETTTGRNISVDRFWCKKEIGARQSREFTLEQANHAVGVRSACPEIIACPPLPMDVCGTLTVLAPDPVSAAPPYLEHWKLRNTIAKTFDGNRDRVA